MYVTCEGIPRSPHVHTRNPTMSHHHIVATLEYSLTFTFTVFPAFLGVPNKLNTLIEAIREYGNNYIQPYKTQGNNKYNRFQTLKSKCLKL